VLSLRTVMNTKTMFSSGKDDWETPDDFFELYNYLFHFSIDLAANEINHKCLRWFGPGGEVEDALSVEWDSYLLQGNLWLNPPYSRKLQRKFVEKAADAAEDHRAYLSSPEGDGHFHSNIVCLLPARTDTKLFHEIIQPCASEIGYVKGRLKFKGAEHGAPFPSMVVIF
jgi:phage N-6-adenine-methyltransferase